MTHHRAGWKRPPLRRSVKLALWGWGLVIVALLLFFIPGYNGAWLLVTVALCALAFWAGMTSMHLHSKGK